jgi:predicted nucleic acid-binding protein
MIVLDTNVVSELMRENADENVLAWLEGQASSALFTTTLSEAEVRLGLAFLATGKRRTALVHAADDLFKDFGPRVLTFDSDAAVAYALIGAERKRAGRPIAVIDAQIAAIVRVHGAVLATRNVKDFQGCGIDLIDPWSESRP